MKQNKFEDLSEEEKKKEVERIVKENYDTCKTTAQTLVEKVIKRGDGKPTPYDWVVALAIAYQWAAYDERIVDILFDHDARINEEGKEEWEQIFWLMVNAAVVNFSTLIDLCERITDENFLAICKQK